jgi:hypothetical protein
VEEGLHLARRCGLGLYHIELLCAQAELSLGGGDLTTAEAAARDAFEQARGVDCQFLWGAAEAGHLLGQTLAARGEDRAAAAVLQEALALRRQLGDPRAVQTKRLLQGVQG